MVTIPYRLPRTLGLAIPGVRPVLADPPSGVGGQAALGQARHGYQLVVQFSGGSSWTSVSWSRRKVGAGSAVFRVGSTALTRLR